MDWKAIVKNLEQERESLLADSKKVYLVNAGRMNHGKSSLLNSILGRDEFVVKDVRETRVNKEVKVASNIYIVDTPGLDAEESDDAEAYEIYKKANFIFFVHNPKAGEFHKDELEHLRAIEKLLGKDYFWSHIAFVVTHMEEMKTQADLDTITAKMKEALKKEFQIIDADVRIFMVSNARYARARKEKDVRKRKIFLDKSGIHLVRKFIKKHIREWKSESIQLQEQRFQNARAKVEADLQKEYEARKVRVDKIKEESENCLQDINYHLQEVVERMRDREEACQKAKESYEEAKRKLEELDD